MITKIVVIGEDIPADDKAMLESALRRALDMLGMPFSPTTIVVGDMDRPLAVYQMDGEPGATTLFNDLAELKKIKSEAMADDAQFFEWSLRDMELWQDSVSRHVRQHG